MVETNVHFPTDINLLFDALRKAISLTATFADNEKLQGWRQSYYNIRQVKRAYRAAQQTKRSTSKKENKNPNHLVWCKYVSEEPLINKGL